MMNFIESLGDGDGMCSSDVPREPRAVPRGKRANSRASDRLAQIPRAPGSRRSARLARRPSGRSLGSLAMSFRKSKKR